MAAPGGRGSRSQVLAEAAKGASDAVISGSSAPSAPRASRGRDYAALIAHEQETADNSPDAPDPSKLAVLFCFFTNWALIFFKGADSAKKRKTDARHVVYDFYDFRHRGEPVSLPLESRGLRKT